MRTIRPRTWWNKFADAIVGVWLGVRGQSSFVVHSIMAMIVVIAAAIMRMTIERWCILVLCIVVVMTAELFNSALEILAKAVDENDNDRLRDSLNIASGAVLVAAIGAALVGAIVFIARLIELFASAFING